MFLFSSTRLIIQQQNRLCMAKRKLTQRVWPRKVCRHNEKLQAQMVNHLWRLQLHQRIIFFCQHHSLELDVRNAKRNRNIRPKRKRTFYLKLFNQYPTIRTTIIYIWRTRIWKEQPLKHYNEKKEVLGKRCFDKLSILTNFLGLYYLPFSDTLQHDAVVYVTL